MQNVRLPKMLNLLHHDNFFLLESGVWARDWYTVLGTLRIELNKSIVCTHIKVIKLPTLTCWEFSPLVYLSFELSRCHLKCVSPCGNNSVSVVLNNGKNYALLWLVCLIWNSYMWKHKIEYIKADQLCWRWSLQDCCGIPARYLRAWLFTTHFKTHAYKTQVSLQPQLIAVEVVEDATLMEWILLQSS